MPEHKLFQIDSIRVGGTEVIRRARAFFFPGLDEGPGCGGVRICQDGGYPVCRKEGLEAKAVMLAMDVRE